MSLRSWLGRAGTVAVRLLVHLGAASFFSVGPLPGVHYRDPEADPAAPEAWPPGAAHGPYGGGGRIQEPPAGHPERHCTTPATPVERQLWAALGVDVDGIK